MPVSPRSLALSLTVGLSCAVAAFVVLAGPGTIPATPSVAAMAAQAPPPNTVATRPVISVDPCPLRTVETADACVRVVHAPPLAVASPAPVPSPAAVYVVRPAVPTQRTAPASVPPVAAVDAAPQEPQQTEPPESELPESEG
jgi:hypothetical protein